jgi:hypothetical protein
VTRDDTRALQQRLNEIGWAHQVLGAPLAEDGIYGPRTDQAYAAWLDQEHVVPTVTPPPAVPWWTSRALLGILAAGLAWLATQAGWLVEAEQITQILVHLAEAVGLALALWGTLRRRAPIDPTLVARLPGRDLRLPVRAHRPDRPRPGPDQRRDPRGHFNPD